MADIDDVNAQHLASMGLADTPTGQPYATNEAGPPKDNTGRCPSTNEDGFRCALKEGHVYDVHIRGPLRWGAEPDAGPKWCHDINPRNSVVYCVLLADHEGSHKSGALHWWSEDEAVPTKQREGDQALPKPGQRCVQDLVIAEMEESKRVGTERYGSTLQTFNGRRSIQDVAEEVRDLHVYLTQVKAESETDRETLVAVVTAALQRVDDETEAERAPDLGYDDLAKAAVDAIMGWVVGQTMGLDRTSWGIALVDAYYDRTQIDFNGASVPQAIQDHILDRESKR